MMVVFRRVILELMPVDANKDGDDSIDLPSSKYTL